MTELNNFLESDFKPMKNTDIAIVGMSCLFPGAENLDTFWDNVLNGIDSNTEVPEDRIDPEYFKFSTNSKDAFYCKKGGFIPTPCINLEKLGITESYAKELDPSYLLALHLVYSALEDAQVFKKNISLNKSSIIIGKSSYPNYSEINSINANHTAVQLVETIKNILPEITEEEISKIKNSFKEANSFGEKQNNVSSLPSFIAQFLNIKGGAYTVDASTVSSLLAVKNSITELLNDTVDISIAGGLHFSHTPDFWKSLNEKSLFSKNERMSPFSENADGILLGEGAGFIVLKKLDKAISDNDRIYAVIKGLGIVNEYNNISEGQIRSISEALLNSSLQPEDIFYVEANGTSIKSEDSLELESLKNIYSNDSHTLHIGSVKANIGHTMSASGMAGIIKTVLSLYNRQIPQTIHSENPIELLAGKYVVPVTKTIEWQNDTIPLIAGVNDFNNEGTYAHLILKSHDKNPSQKKLTFTEEVIAITAKTKEELIYAIDNRNFTFSDINGDYRLIVFNPTPERLEKAKKLIAKDKPWKGRQDIWFSNKPLLKGNGKIAFLFPGFDPSSNPEVQSIAEYFGCEIPEETAQSNPILNQSFKQFHAGEIIDSSLKTLGVIPDMNAGHSLGEWFAAKSSGLISNDSVKNLLASMDPDKYQVSNAYFIAAGCGVDKLNPYIEKIPDLYVSNDNCPSQILLCGTEQARDSILDVLKSKQIFHQVLPFQSGFHSPFIKDKLYLLDEALEHIKIEHNQIPVWSATTLELYPDNFKDFKELTIKHLLQAVRFRELIEKMYTQENARMFIQIGSGSLIGFVDDILKNKEYSAISAYVSNRTTLEQLRRILALLFIEGKNDLDTEFLGIKETTNDQDSKFKLSLNVPILKDFSVIDEISKKYHSQPTSINELSTDLFIDSSHPVAMAMNENISALLDMQSELNQLIKSNGNFSVSYKQKITSNNRNIQQTDLHNEENHTQSVESVNKTGKSFEENLYVDIKEHPYLIDHSLFKQPSHWTILEDIGPVIPMTMTFELLIEAAHKQDINKKVLRLGPVSVFQWMKVFTPFSQKIEGTWKSEEQISLKIKNFATGEVLLGNSFPTPDPHYLNEIEWEANTLIPPTKETIYKEHMFHGPGYQGIIEVTNINEKGLRGFIKKSTGKGSLLDNIGQLYGLFLQLTLGDESSVSFPVKIEEINFYQDVQDQQGVFECICLPTSLTAQIATADIIIKREGKIWCIIKGWKNQIFEGFDKKLWNLTMSPSEYILSDNIAPDIYFFDNAYSKAINWEFLMNIYLNQEEKRHYDSLMLNKKKDYLISRISLKDSVRKFIENHSGKKYYPIEFNVQYDPNRKPSIHGVPETKNMEISIAHKGSNSVTISSYKPVGIDIETIENRDKGFMDLAFTSQEMKLLEGKDLAEWTTRFWTAKEAYGKMLGLGLKGNPKQYEVESINGEILTIKNTTINTIKYNNFIIGWTL